MPTPLLRKAPYFYRNFGLRKMLMHANEPVTISLSIALGYFTPAVNYIEIPASSFSGVLFLCHGGCSQISSPSSRQSPV